MNVNGGARFHLIHALLELHSANEYLSNAEAFFPGWNEPISDTYLMIEEALQTVITLIAESRTTG